MVIRLLLLLLLVCAPLSAQVLSNDRVSSALSHDEIGLDENATLTITIKGFNNVTDVPTPTCRPSSGLQISAAGRQYSMTSVNGVTQNSTSFNFLITPLKKGRYVIDGVMVDVNGITHATESHRLEVTDAMGYNRSTSRIPSNPWRNPSYTPGIPNFNPRPEPREDVILEAELEPKEVYKHEPTVYNLRLLYAVQLMGDPHVMPIFPTGFVSVPMEEESGWEYRDGREFRVTEAKTAFYPLSEGEYTFPSTQIQLRTGFLQPGKTLETLPKVLKVKPLPTKGQPSTFTGAVGEQFEIEAKLSRNVVKQGQTVELVISARGDGNLDLVPYPHLPDWDGVEKRQTSGDSKTEMKSGQLDSRRTYRFRIKAREPGRYSLDDITLAYFRPSRERYEVVKVPPLTLTVEEGVFAEEGADGGSVDSLPEPDRPQAEPGPVEPVVGHLSSYILLLAGLVSLGGLLVGLLGLPGKKLRLSFGKTSYRNPKSLDDLHSALEKLAPGNDSLTRASALEGAGWSPEQIASYESLRSRVAAARFGNQGESESLSSLVKQYQDLRKRGNS